MEQQAAETLELFISNSNRNLLEGHSEGMTGSVTFPHVLHDTLEPVIGTHNAVCPQHLLCVGRNLDPDTCQILNEIEWLILSIEPTSYKI